MASKWHQSEMPPPLVAVAGLLMIASATAHHRPIAELFPKKACHRSKAASDRERERVCLARYVETIHERRERK